ncbi:flagellar hook-length control protein FliK [Gynuella sp.]|uniref:flagellar hook-length control protein FliK n=1 Tax=Gynuella sp. TaxID=2969146 RepID=UPI003D0C1454
MQLSPLPTASVASHSSTVNASGAASEADSGLDFMTTMAAELGLEPDTPEYNQFMNQADDAANFLRSRGMSFADVGAILDSDVITEALIGQENGMNDEDSDDLVESDVVALFADFFQFLQQQNPETSAEGDDSEVSAIADVSLLPLADTDAELTDTESVNTDIPMPDAEMETGEEVELGLDGTESTTDSVLTDDLKASQDSPEAILDGEVDMAGETDTATGVETVAAPVSNGQKNSDRQDSVIDEGLEIEPMDADEVANSDDAAKKTTKVQAQSDLDKINISTDSTRKNFNDAVNLAGQRDQAQTKQDQVQVQRSVEIPLKQPVTHSEWANSVNDRIMMMANRHIQVAHIRLDPPDLGMLEIKLSVSHDQQAQVAIVTQHTQVKELLDASMARLRTMLQEQNIELVDAQVSDQSSQGQFSGEQHSQRGYAGGELDSDEEELMPQATAMVSQALLDHYV